MTLMINIPPELEAELLAQAQAQGLSPEVYLQCMVKREMSAKQPERPAASLLGALARYGPAPSAEEIDENRREMFANFARDEQW